MNDGFADRPLKPLGHPHVLGSLTGFEPASGFWTAQLMRLVSWDTTLSRDFAEAEGFEPPTFGFGDRHSTN